MNPSFDDFDFNGFWRGEPAEPPPTDSDIASVEAELGVKQPQAGPHAQWRTPATLLLSMTQATAWAENHINVGSLCAIGRAAGPALCGPYGTPYFHDFLEWPALGVYVGHSVCGHAAVALDYRNCQPNGEPPVVYVSQGIDFT